MSVVNTMSMTVVERTREIGTLRALGIKRGQIVALFSGISYVPPSSSDRVPLLVDVLPGTMLVTFALLALLTSIAAFFPASGASRKGIVDVLGHV